MTAELQRLDLLIQSQVRRSRQLHKTDEQFQGLFISEKEVDELIRSPLGAPRFLAAGDPAEISVETAEIQAAFERAGEEIGSLAAESLRRGISLRLVQAARLFHLEPFDAGCLLVSLAPEIDPRYERLYAYIQDDVTRRRPGVEFVLNLFYSTLVEKLEARQRFVREAPLLYWKLVHFIEDPSQPHP